MSDQVGKAWVWCLRAWVVMIAAWVANFVWAPLAIPLVVVMFMCMAQMVRYHLKARRS